MEAGGATHQSPEREREERRAQENRERLMISLLERMLNKYISQEKTVGKKMVTLQFLNSFFFLIVTLSMKRPNFCSLFL